ncbi:MAG: hypothetical protein ACMUEM_02485 [Flavobacteriales bacterium AspAUS03]
MIKLKLSATSMGVEENIIALGIKILPAVKSQDPMGLPHDNTQSLYLLLCL